LTDKKFPNNDRSNRILVYFSFFHVRRAKQFRVLHVQGEVQFVVEASTARPDLTLDEDLLGRHTVASVTVKEQLVVLFVGIIRVLEWKHVVTAGHVGHATGPRHTPFPDEHAHSSATATTTTHKYRTAVDDRQQLHAHAYAQPFCCWRLA